METRVSPEQVELFANTVRATAEKLGLHDWEIRIATFEDSTTDARQAECRESIAGRIATICLNLENFIDTSNKNIEMLAVHEVLHVLLSEEWNLCNEVISALPEDKRPAYLTRLNSVQHGTINRLVRALTN